MVARWGFFLVASVVLGLDLLSKQFVLAHPGLQGLAVVPHSVHISIAVNSGIFFRLADDLLWPGKPYLLAGLSLTPALMILWWKMRPAPGREPLLTALALIAGGLLGNSADRILHGGVIDFIEVHIEGSVYYPTFNFADLAITAGMILILADALVSRARTHGLPGPLP